MNSKAFGTLLGVLLLGACGGDSTGVNGDATGTYTLQSIGGHFLPYTVFTSSTTELTFKSGSLTINADNTFSETTDFNQTDTSSGQAVVTSATSTCAGTYAQRGNGFTFSESASADPSCGFTYGGSWDGANSLTVSYAPGAMALYTK